MQCIFSVSSEHPELVEFLLKKGANVNHKPMDGNSALIWGAVGGNSKASIHNE